MRKGFLAILILVVLTLANVFASSSYYATGDQVFSFRAGVNYPAFISFVNDKTQGALKFEDTHLKLGGYAAISYQGFISEKVALGGELGYAFNYSLGSLLNTTVPIAAKLSFIPVQTGKFDIVTSLSLGGAFLRYNELKYFAPYLEATIQPTIFFSESWGVGIETGLMTTFELYTKNSNKANDSAIFGMMPIVLTIAYRH